MTTEARTIFTQQERVELLTLFNNYQLKADKAHELMNAYVRKSFTHEEDQYRTAYQDAARAAQATADALYDWVSERTDFTQPTDFISPGIHDFEAHQADLRRELAAGD